MPALNYTQFVPKVENGTKRQTIRAMRKRPIRPGDVLFHYMKMRTPDCIKIHTDTICKSADTIIIDYDFVSVNGRTLSDTEIRELAKADGFSSVADFYHFFHKTHGFPFLGQLVKW